MWAAMLGPTLRHAGGAEDTTRCMEGVECVMIYVSAHWCGPCRALTPKLASAYQRQTGNVRVVFVSLDHDQVQFDEYFQTMPWHAVQYEEDRYNVINELSDLTQTPIKSIPSLLVFSPTGQLITSDGCGKFEDYLKPTAG